MHAENLTLNLSNRKNVCTLLAFYCDCNSSFTWICKHAGKEANVGAQQECLYKFLKKEISTTLASGCVYFMGPGTLWSYRINTSQKT